MNEVGNKNENYYQHLKGISFLGRMYQKYFKAVLLILCARRFGGRMVEVGSGLGNGVLGAFPSKVTGLDINPILVDHCNQNGLTAKLIREDGSFPFKDGEFGSCIIDNVLEHIENPTKTLDECFRITSQKGGLVIVVPGLRGYDSDSDHKIYYDERKLASLDDRWELIVLFAIPSIFKSKWLSQALRPYCLLAVYKKNALKVV